MKRIKYLTQAEVEERAKHKIATIGRGSSVVKKIYGTITTNPYGYRYNTQEVSMMVDGNDFTVYWNIRAKKENVTFELYADRAV